MRCGVEAPGERALRLGIEHRAVTEVRCSWEYAPYGVGEDEAAASTAISLKRIADALETLAGELAHPEWGVAPAIREAVRNQQ